jgi:hypothetical protein
MTRKECTKWLIEAFAIIDFAADLWMEENTNICLPFEITASVLCIGIKILEGIIIWKN